MSGDDLETIDIACELVRETPDALLVDDGDNEVWVPRSCASFVPDRSGGRNGTLTIAVWMAEKKGMI